MGRRGPPAKPTAQKRREGTYRKDRAPTREPAPTAGVPPCPPGISTDLDARGCWERLVPELTRLKLLTLLDGPALEGLCRAYAVAVKADRKLRQHGVIVKTPWGLQQNPAVTISRSAWAEVRRFAAEFGLSPAARSRVSVPKGSEADPAEQFLFPGMGDGKVVGTIGPR